jgi:pyruvate kinase
MKKAMPSISERYPCNPPELEPLIEQMLAVRHDLLRKEMAYKNLDKIHEINLKSARNLLHYMAFRLHDLRDLQLFLSEWGLSSLGRAERKVQATVDTVLHTLHTLANRDFVTKEKPPVCYREGRAKLEGNTEKLLGELPPGRRVRIMVTMPTEAATNYDLVKNLLLGGMNCARINCAHDDTSTWSGIIQNIRQAEEATGRKCKIHMDLGGPKLRTGPIELGPMVVKVRPKRNELGKTIEPALIWLFAEGHFGEDKKKKAPKGTAAQLPMPADWVAQCKPGDRIDFFDARGAFRRLKIKTASPEGVLVTVKKTCYFIPKLSLRLERKGAKIKHPTGLIGEGIPHLPTAISLKPGDALLLKKQQVLGKNAVYYKKGKLKTPATLSISIPSVVEDVHEGEPIWFDDGKIGGIIERKTTTELLVRITQAKPGGDLLKGEKGINLPESKLNIKALTDDDLQDLKFVVEHADMVGLSFANHPADVEDLVQQMKTLRKDRVPAVVLKIETRLGFENLPAMLLSAMQAPSCGVMIARGDLAIECGFGRLAEVQEQILWVCEAAHVPVIWATQVLEGLAKSGLPTRAEVTDAAMGQRAECIMLNKGEHIVEATKALADILLRMQDHQTKKRSLLRKLSIAERFFEKKLN